MDTILQIPVNIGTSFPPISASDTVPLLQCTPPEHQRVLLF